jgi:hypothetical protein
MSEPPRSSAAGAGIMLVLVIVVCAAVGLGIGALTGSPAPFAIGGGAVGLVAGFALVYSRFKNI